VREPTSDEQDLAKDLISGGADIAGAATGAAIGLVGGPAGVVGGAAAGAAIGRVLGRVGAEIRRRRLGPREEVRVGAAAAFAGERIQEHLNAGRVPRDDGFFEPGKNGEASSAEELLEGVLLKARDAYEERKTRHLGILYGNLAFHPEISAEYGNFLVSLLGDLTYRQLVVLAIASDGSRAHLRATDYRGDEAALDRLGLEGPALLTEIFNLYQRGLLSDTAGEAWLSVPDVAPARLRAQGAGHVLVQLADLQSVAGDVRRRVEDTLA
jgi:hypothetical protein